MGTPPYVKYMYPDRLCPIEEALALQEELFQQKLAGDENNYILLAEHQSVYTCSPWAVANIDALCKIGQSRLPAPLHPLPEDPGGPITYHGPGQLVCYLILDLGQFEISILRFAKLIEEIGIETLAHFGIRAHSKPEGFPGSAGGVWVTRVNGEQQEIAARGVRVSKLHGGVTKYGFALNVSTDLTYFNDYIFPCGCDIYMTSMREITGQEYRIWNVADVIAKITTRKLYHMAEVARSRTFAKQ